MSVELYLSILLFSVLLTIWLTEFLKNLLNEVGVPYRTHAVVLDSAMVCTTLVSIVYKTILNLGLSFSFEQVFRLVLVILSTWVTSTLVYDKLQITKRQYKEAKQRELEDMQKAMQKAMKKGGHK